MKRRLHIVVTCTKQKSVAAAPNLCLSDISAKDLRNRFAQWQHRLETTTDTHVIDGLYNGDHWVTAQQLLGIATTAGVDASLSVISTGLGLVQNHEKVPTYSATFSPTHCDAVSRKKEDFVLWWDMLCKWRREKRKSPASIKDLVATDPNASFLIVVSNSYLSAVQPDLERAIDELGNGGELLVVSAGANPSGQLTKFLLPADARFQKKLGGIRRSLNIRLAKKLLQEFPSGRWRADRVIEKFRERLKKLPPLEIHNRTPTSDAEVKRFIDGGLRAKPPLSKTVLLRKYRESGRACEQQRFGRIYQTSLEVKRAS